MPNQVKQVLTRRNIRGFIQKGGAAANNPVLFTGRDMTYIETTGRSSPRSGGIEAINNHDPARVGQYVVVGKTKSAPDLPTASFTFRELVGGIPNHKYSALDCVFTYYEVLGICSDLSDFVTGWKEGYMMVYPDAEVTSQDDGDGQAFDSDDPLATTVEVTFRERPYPIGALGFGAASTTLTTSPQADITFGNQYQCADCGNDNDGTKWIYAAGAAVDSSTKPTVAYSTDGGLTWGTPLSITTAANDEDIILVRVVGRYLVCISRTASSSTIGGYYYAEINQYTGVPGTFTKVTTGFLASKQPNDAYVDGNTLYIAADAGYIYYTTDITAGVSVLHAGAATTVNLLRIHGFENVLVATGGTSTVIRSVNKGQNFSATTTSPVSGAHNIGALSVKSTLEFWVGTISGTNTGRVYYTRNGGESWTELTFTGNGAGKTTDIVWATKEFGYISHSTAAPVARLFAIFAGGSAGLSNTAPRITGLPTSEDEFTRLAIPTAATTPVRANTIAIAGLAGNGTDGIIYLGKATTV